MLQNLLLAVVTGLITLIACIALLRLASKDRSVVELRLQQLLGPGEAAPREQRTDRPQRKQHIPVSKVLADELSSAGIRMRPEEYLVIWLIFVLAPSGILGLMGAHPVTLFAAALLCVIIPPVIVFKRRNKRVILFEQQLGDALMLMSNSLRSGLTFQQAMAIIAKEMPDPIGKEFSRTVRETQLGSNVDTALTNMVQRVHSTDLMLTVSAIQIQRQVGGNMLEILENTAATIKDRIKLKNDIRVLTATGRTSGMVVGMIPVAILGMLMLINPDYVMVFFDTPLGIGMLVTAAVMELIGFVVIRRIVTIKY